MVRRPSIFVLAFTLGATACVDTSPDRVKLTAEVTGATLTVAAGSLVTALSGGFALDLALGDHAPHESTVATAPSIDLVTAGTNATLRVLDATPSGDGFPLTLKPGDHPSLAFTLSDQNTLSSTDETAACAGPVRISVTVVDAANGDEPTLATSGDVSISGCP